MKKMVLSCFLLIFLCCGCSLAVTENNLLKTRTAKANELQNGKSMAERATDVKEQIGRIDGVTGSAVVIEGHTAIIGLRTKDLQKKEQKQLIDNVQTAAVQTDDTLYFVSVTVDENIVSQIEKEEKTRMR